MISYASATNSPRNLDAMERHGWRLLYTPFSTSRVTSRFAYCLDNGAWTAFQQGRPFDEAAFTRLLRSAGTHADFVVIPDVVAGGAESLAFSLRWMRRVLDETERGLIAVQNGMQPGDVESLIGQRVGIFVGGDTAWKLATMPTWSELARKRGAWVHVGRVNTCRRINLCHAAGVDSFDGTSPTKFSCNTARLSHARDQMGLFQGTMQ